jgi:3-deoxy-7-phosphoheptulonate synthase
LIGLSGSGKTTLGGLLAKELAMPFVDLDQELEKRTGMSVSEIFELRGEAYFRDVESDATRETLAKSTPSVVATGGGVVLRPENMRILRENGFVIFLDRPVDHITGDLVYDGSRPLIKKADKLYEMERERRPVYIGGADAALRNDAGVTEAIDGLLEICRIEDQTEPYTLASRRFQPQDTVVGLPGGQKIGGGRFAVIAGPSSIESEEQILSIAREVRLSGAHFLRGGAFKPHDSSRAFQGLGLEGLNFLKIAREKTGLPIVTEILSEEQCDIFERDVDIIQIGARNARNFPLLRQVGALGKPVLLKRGPSCTIDETLQAADSLLAEGKSQVILCERGIHTFETATRNTLDLSAVPVLKKRSRLPVIVDPSHGTGRWDLVFPMAMAAVAAGADGLMIEVHNHPEQALCDGQQSITPLLFDRLMRKALRLREIIHEDGVRVA